MKKIEMIFIGRLYLVKLIKKYPDKISKYIEFQQTLFKP
jgi:hypothetical protein